MTRSRKNALQVLYCLLLSCGVLTICSKNSFLYPLNDWVDVNCFFTVGRGIRHGLVPYLDLYDQKGPLLYFVYALAALISENSFLGVFLIEVILYALFLFYSGRIAETLSSFPAAFFLTAAGTGIAVPLTPAFSHGGSAEEFFLPVFAASLYLVLKTIRERNPMNWRQGVLMGLFAAAAFWTKYTFCGLYAGLAAAVLIIYLAGGRIKELLRLILCFLAGFLSLSALILLWYLLRGGLPALWNAYFIDNLTSYSQNIRGGNYPDPLPNLLNNLPWSIPLFLGLTGLLLQIRKQWRGFLAVLLSSVGLFVFTYWSGRKYPYYALVMASFAPVGYGVMFRLIPATVKTRRGFRRAVAGAAALTAALSPFAAYAWSSNFYLTKIPREGTPQYRFGEIISASEDASLLNYGFLDGGFYFASGSLPVTRFFCTLNNNLPEMEKEHRTAIAEGKPAYLVVRGKRAKGLENYQLIDECSMVFEGREWTYYLYRRFF